ncbi:MAG: pyridoxal phosphate-dependent decarboxylase family protein [Planctomycetota bacterium]|jgi:aromatic-L-amino-acid decarboxylase
MDVDAFRSHAHDLVDWMADYMEHVEEYPVKSRARPREILNRLPETPPEEGEAFKTIFNDFQEIILPGVTHWQHPGWFAYFPANGSPPSVLAEMLTATLGIQAMIWQTSPSAAELEERVLDWLRQMLGLPEGLSGCIQDTASTATLVSILTAREKHSDFKVNDSGLQGAPRYTCYCSTEAHSSIEKAVKIAGLGKESVRKVEVDERFALKPDKLEEAVKDDLDRGFTPLAVVAATGTTGSTAIDPLRPIGEICRKHNIWFHVDAAFAGSALLLPECRWMADGVDLADTFVFNPHKWLFTNFDCSAYFVKDEEALVRTFEIMPEYLKTREDDRVNNYRDWGIQLGRRFRALKLWFVIRSYGVEGLRQKIRHHIELAQEVVRKIEQSDDFELLAPAPLQTVCFRYKPSNVNDEDALNRLNAELLDKLNATGEAYLTHTKLKGAYTIRFMIGQTHVAKRHVDQAWKRVKEIARSLPHP